jgi:hypothetical protein
MREGDPIGADAGRCIAEKPHALVSCGLLHGPMGSGGNTGHVGRLDDEGDLESGAHGTRQSLITVGGDASEMVVHMDRVKREAPFETYRMETVDQRAGVLSS